MRSLALPEPAPTGPPDAAAPDPLWELTALRAALLNERTQREQAETEVLRLQAIARLPELNPNPVLRLAPDGTVRFANAAAAELGRELRTLGPSMLRPRLLSATVEALRTNEPQTQELRSGGQDFLLRAVPVPEEGSALLYLTNITAQRAAEQELREQQELHQLTLRHLPASVSVLDADQRCRYNNAHDASGSDRPDWRIGHTFGEFCLHYGLPFTLATRRRRLFERAVHARSAVEWEEQWPAQADGGQPVYWLRSYQPVYHPDGSLRLMMSYGLDITRRREAEEATRRSEAVVLAQQAFTSQVLDTCPNVIFVRDEQGKIVFGNAAMREATAVAEQRMAAETGRDGVARQEYRRFAEADARVLRTGLRVTTDDPFTVAPDDTRWFQTIRQLLRPPGGGPPQVLGVSTDITALKRAQQAAEAAAEARENFLANVSHEIRTPLNGVLGMAGLLASTALNAEQQHYLSVIRNSGRNLLAVLNDVLDMAKITSGKLELERIAFDLTTALHTAAQTLAFRATEKGLTFELKLPPTLRRPAWVCGDPYRLTQVLLNLLSNAIKFTQQGGVTLHVKTLRRTRQHLRLRVLVQDTGPGIATARQEAVFDSFAQASASTTREFGGTGLGLSISRGLVAQLAGGPLLMCSEEGEGSSFCFVLSLPRVAPPAPPSDGQGGSQSAAAAVRGRRVLLVEDNAVNRELARLLLVRNDVRVDEASTGTEALACFDEHRYDAVLMDIQMPGMSGLEAAAHLRRHPDPSRAATPIIALTANAFRADAERYRAAGLDDTLAKPFEEAELLAKLAAVLRPELAGAAGSLAPPAASAPAVAPALTTGVDLPTPAAPFDLSLLHETAQGSTDFVNRVLAAFHATAPAGVQELAAARAAADWPAVAAVAHRVRPSLKLLGATRLLPVLATLEADAAPEEALRAATLAFEHGLQELLDALPREVVLEEN